MADSVKNFPQRLYKMTKVLCREVPSQAEVHHWVDRMINLLFPVRDRRNVPLYEIEAEWNRLQDDLLRIITPLCADQDCDSQALSARFFSEIPLLYTGLMQDAKIYHQCDPAAFCREEVILCYPGFYAVAVYRLAHVLYLMHIPILPRVITEYAHSQTGIDIHPGATIGPRFYIDHGTGVVIGETCVIGKNVKVYQGVTLGAKFVDKELQGVRRHPKIEDNVIIYAGSTILGGDTVIGHDTVIGGNVWLTESVPPRSTVYHQPEISINGAKRR